MWRDGEEKRNRTAVSRFPKQNAMHRCLRSIIGLPRLVTGVIVTQRS
jgi:hypothetical protein